MSIDERLVQKHDSLSEYIKRDDLGAFWKLWSTCVEQGMLRYLGNSMHTDQKNLGRGLVQIIKQKAFKEVKAEDESKGDDDDDGYKHIRNKFTRKAIECLRQARRCEQFAYRLDLKMKGKGKSVHDELNKHALYKIVKESKEEEHWEVELAEKLVQDIDKQIGNVMLQPLLKRSAEKYHAQHDKWKKEAKKEEEERKARRYEDKAKGQWNLVKDIGCKNTHTLGSCKKDGKGTRRASTRHSCD